MFELIKLFCQLLFILEALLGHCKLTSIWWSTRQMCVFFVFFLVGITLIKPVHLFLNRIQPELDSVPCWVGRDALFSRRWNSDGIRGKLSIPQHTLFIHLHHILQHHLHVVAFIYLLTFFTFEKSVHHIGVWKWLIVSNIGKMYWLMSMTYLTFYNQSVETWSDQFGLTCRHRETDPRGLLNILTGPNLKAADMYYRLREFWIRFHCMHNSYHPPGL